MKIKFRFNIIILSLILCIYADAQKLKLAELFNEGAVLQRNFKVTVWGTSAPVSNVTVNVQGKHFQSKSDNNGVWNMNLSALKEGGPYSMQVICSNDTVNLKEIYIGEVWIAGGQSNMGWKLDQNDGAKEHIANATNKNIRFVMVPYLAYEGDKTRGDMNWRAATTEYVSEMSAVAYFFAKDLQTKLNVPIGIICCYKGGSGAETWMSRESLLKNPELAPIV